MTQAGRAAELPSEGTSLDSEMLARVGGDRELLAEVIELFLEDGPMAIEAMRRGLAAGDHAVVRSAAHSLAGSAANFGAIEVTTLARRLEAGAAADDLAAANQVFAALQNAVLQMLDRLVAIKAGLSCAS
jgi:HPt (histidine-containing phosphotransfer) domain-containing protein